MVREWNPRTAASAEIEAVLSTLNAAFAVDLPDDPQWRVHSFREYLAVTMPGERRVCWLAEPVLSARLIAPISLGCAHDQLQPGVALTLVGYGVDETGLRTLGTKRSTTAPIGTLDREISVGDELHGPCSGDSGGPAFVPVRAFDGVSEWALAGVLSSGVEGTTCSTGYYTDLAKVVGWLEAETATDLTPCFEGSTWRPTEQCLRPDLDERGVPIEGAPQLSQACGAPYRPTEAGCSQVRRAHDRAPAWAFALAGLLLLRARAQRARRRIEQAPSAATLAQ